TASKRPIFLEQNLINSSEPVPESLSIFIRNSIQLNYKISDQFDIILKGRFNTNGIHGRWAYYPEPPLLLLGGVTYKFDFQY
ncbi:MAG: hypothetical protein CMC63_07115, partial [Flavobacteriaceae bacterium]|nr:hypothetical protein [Flavobacteriaceae bacterium]